MKRACVRRPDNDWAMRMKRARARALGLTPERYEDELQGALRFWRASRPWRWLPQRVALALFPWFGRHFAAQWIERSPARRKG